jgi:hypothetical protein
MRATVGKALKLYPGDQARIHVRLPQGEKQCRVFVWSRVGNDDFSPHIPLSQVLAVSSDKPNLLKPVMTFVNADRPKSTLVVDAEEELELLIKQEKDYHDDAEVKVRVTRRSRRAVAAYLAIKQFFRRFALKDKQGQRIQHV